MADRVALTAEEHARIKRIAACDLKQQWTVATVFFICGAILLLYAVVQLLVPRLALVHHQALQWIFLVLAVFVLFLGGLRYGYYMLFRLITHLESEREMLAGELKRTQPSESEGIDRDAGAADSG